MKPPAFTFVLATAALTTIAWTSVNRGPEWVDARVKAWLPTVAERRWENIGWAKDIRTAERLARENRRPVFLFTHDGRLNVGRC